MSRGWRQRQLRKQLVENVEVIGGEHLRDAVVAGHGIMICPNHSVHYDSAALYKAADQIDTPLYMMSAWQVFAMSSLHGRWMMQADGLLQCEPRGDRSRRAQTVDRNSAERTISIGDLSEGDIYHVSDYVMPFREGAAAIALSAARKATRRVVTIPCGIRSCTSTIQRPSSN